MKVPCGFQAQGTAVRGIEPRFPPDGNSNQFSSSARAWARA